MKKRVSFLIMGAALTLSLILYYSRTSDLTIVKVTQVRRDDIIDYIKTTGRMEAVEDAVLRARETARVARVLVEEGDQVKSGEQILLFDRTESAYAVKRAELELEQAKISIQETKAKLEASERTYADPSELESTLKIKEDNYKQALIAGDSAERNLKIAEELYKAGAESFLSLQEKKDQMKTTQMDLLKTTRELEEARQFCAGKEKSTLNLTTLKTAYERALKRKALAKVELEIALQHLDNLTCISPLDGTVTANEVKEGMVVSAGQVLMTIADIKKLQVRSEVDELDAGRIKKGQEAIITFDALPDQTFHGHIKRVSPQAEIKGERTVVETIIRMDEPENLLKISNQVDVRIIREKKGGVLLLPLSVVQRGARHSFVWLYRDETAHAVEVTTGLSDTSLLEITGGLRDGDQVVINCLNKLKEGARLKIEIEPKKPKI